ncbi:FtsX-like permease family protein [Actinomyces sp.]|uniref:FtsX-like permease family protein n=1 Tax=Actinomyces sp. TaxID=29317 RepID=UPI0026DCA882|nr:FtsX-like permease family protein [Actinomyces sp.]MDO4901622.1 ABC transporter permease [Actinomyces sp.]
MKRRLTLWHLPCLSLRAHPARTAILLALVFAQAACVFSGLLLVQGLRQQAALAEQRLGANVLVYPTAAMNHLHQDQLLMQGTPVQVYRPRSTLSRLDDNDDIAAVSYQLYLSDTRADGQQLWIVGFDPDTDFVISPWLAEGPDCELGDGVAVGSGVEATPAGPDSQTVELFGRPRTVAAHLLPTGSELDTAVFVSLEVLGEVIDDSLAAGVDAYADVDPQRDYSAALLQVQDREDVEAVTAWINIYVRKVTAVGADASLTATASGIGGHTAVIVAATGCAWLLLLAALVIVQRLLMRERRAELYVWQVVGASHRMIGRVMAGEAALVHAVGALAGVAVAAPLLAGIGSDLLADGAATPSRMLPAAGLTLLVSVCLGVLSAWLMTGRSLRGDGRQMLLME